ncbi:hypothetical protein FACS189487_06790 [Campylobacterota bacterium]|nr:hypothetical protein FACS189487_06790 [Campylobacterota bacterium]
MRLLVLFDLPVKSKHARKQAAKFRQFLLKDGYTMLQFSVYVRVIRGVDSIDKHLARIAINLPSRGNVRVLTITEKQYERMLIMLGVPKKAEKIGSQQLILF